MFIAADPHEALATLPLDPLLMVAFSATQFGSYAARLVVESSDASRPVVALPLMGSVGL